MLRRASEQEFDFFEARQRASGVLGDVRACSLCGEMQSSLRKLEVRFYVCYVTPHCNFCRYVACAPVCCAGR